MPRRREFGLFKLDVNADVVMVFKGTIGEINRWAKESRGLSFRRDAKNLFGGYWVDESTGDAYGVDIIGGRKGQARNPSTDENEIRRDINLAISIYKKHRAKHPDMDEELVGEDVVDELHHKDERFWETVDEEKGITGLGYEVELPVTYAEWLEWIARNTVERPEELGVQNPVDGDDPPLSTMAKLVIEDHPNPDFSDEPCSRRPMIVKSFQGKIGDLIRTAVEAHFERPTGRTLVAEIVLKDGSRYEVAQNGRVWASGAREWTPETREVTKYTNAGRQSRKGIRSARNPTDTAEFNVLMLDPNRRVGAGGRELKVIETVEFDASMSNRDVWKELTGHRGYPPEVVVQRKKSKN